MLRNLKDAGTPSKLTNSDCLYLYLSASGEKYWRGGKSFGFHELQLHIIAAVAQFDVR